MPATFRSSVRHVLTHQSAICWNHTPSSASNRTLDDETIVGLSGTKPLVVRWHGDRGPFPGPAQQKAIRALPRVLSSSRPGAWAASPARWLLA